MKNLSVQMLTPPPDAVWFAQLLERFAIPGEPYEIRCWHEEAEAIAAAAQWGRVAERTATETVIRGTQSPAMLAAIPCVNPATDRDLYHKMTPYFTLTLGQMQSAHYGTELYFFNLTDPVATDIRAIFDAYSDCFSVGEW